MSRRAYRSSIPANAVEVVEDFHSDGVRKSASYFVSGEKVGGREWDEKGRLDFEYGMRHGVKHGHEYRFHPNGQPLDKETYRNGTLHGLGKQWDEDGRLLVTWKLVNGVGLDLWCDAWTGTLAEEHYWPREGELGYTRLWNEDEKTIHEEQFFVLGKGYHGVCREWNGRGSLRRGFPHYYVNDERVTKRQYLRACETDPLLPPCRRQDDDPHRELPAAYVAQRRRR